MLAKRDWYWPRIRRAKRTESLVCRLGAYLGWWKGQFVSSPFGPNVPFGPRVWFYRASSRELAGVIVSELNGRADFLHYDRNELEDYLRPRFGVVQIADTGLRISAQRCIDLIRQGRKADRGGKPALAMGQIAMGVADEMFEAAARLTPTQSALESRAPDQATSNADATPPTAQPGKGEGKGGARRAAEPPELVEEGKENRQPANGLPAEPADAALPPKESEHSTERGEGRANDQATLRLFNIFTNGLADERLDRMRDVLNDDKLSVDDKLWKIDALIPIPPTVSAAKLGKAMGVSKTAIQKTTWYIKKRKGQKNSEIEGRQDLHRQRGQQYEFNRKEDDD